MFRQSPFHLRLVLLGFFLLYHASHSVSASARRFWSLLPLILPRTIRERVYYPAQQELLEEYLNARRHCRTNWADRGLTCRFTGKTLVLVLQSLAAWLWDRAAAASRCLFLALAGEDAVRGLRGVFSDLFRRL
jgi:hypothetical protein